MMREIFGSNGEEGYEEFHDDLDNLYSGRYYEGY
jgi:hypothetical protein